MNHPLKIRLKEAAISAGLSLDQVRELTKAQIAELIDKAIDNADWSGGNVGLVTAIQRHTVLELEKEEREIDRLFILNELTGGVRTKVIKKFTDIDMTTSTINGKLCVIIWPEGQPEGEDD